MNPEHDVSVLERIQALDGFWPSGGNQRTQQALRLFKLWILRLPIRVGAHVTPIRDHLPREGPHKPTPIRPHDTLWPL